YPDWSLPSFPFSSPRGLGWSACRFACARSAFWTLGASATESRSRPSRSTRRWCSLSVTARRPADRARPDDPGAGHRDAGALDGARDHSGAVERWLATASPSQLEKSKKAKLNPAAEDHATSRSSLGWLPVLMLNGCGDSLKKLPQSIDADGHIFSRAVPTPSTSRTRVRGSCVL